MARVARRVALSLPETKRFAILNENYTLPVTATSQSSAYAYRNVFSPLVQDVTSFGVVGSELYPRILSLNIKCLVRWSDNYQWNNLTQGVVPVKFHVWLVASNEQFSAATPARYDYQATNNPGWFYQPASTMPRLNGNNLKVLKSWHKIVNPPSLVQGSGSTAVSAMTTVTGKMKYRWKRKITFEDTNTLATNQLGYISSPITRGWNYYILAGWSTPVAQDVGTLKSYTPGIIIVDSFMYYKDP